MFVILSHFLPFYPTNKSKSQNFEKMKKNSSRYYHFTFVYHEWRSYDVWFLRHGVQQAKSFLILDHSLSFHWKIKILKKKPGDIITLHLCTRNDKHMMYGSLDTRCNEQSFLWTIFFPFDPPKNLENQNFDKMKKKKKKYWRYYHLYHKWINENHMIYGSWNRECDRLNFFLL